MIYHPNVNGTLSAVRLAWGSRSAATTDTPSSAYIHQRWYPSVLLPTPPLLLKNAIVVTVSSVCSGMLLLFHPNPHTVW